MDTTVELILLSPLFSEIPVDRRVTYLLRRLYRFDDRRIRKLLWDQFSKDLVPTITRRIPVLVALPERQYHVAQLVHDRPRRPVHQT